MAGALIVIAVLLLPGLIGSSKVLLWTFYLWLINKLLSWLIVIGLVSWLASWMFGERTAKAIGDIWLAGLRLIVATFSAIGRLVGSLWRRSG
jgi:hypothetical protein